MSSAWRDHGLTFCRVASRVHRSRQRVRRPHHPTPVLVIKAMVSRHPPASFRLEKSTALRFNFTGLFIKSIRTVRRSLSSMSMIVATRPSKAPLANPVSAYGPRGRTVNLAILETLMRARLFWQVDLKRHRLGTRHLSSRPGTSCTSSQEIPRYCRNWRCLEQVDGCSIGSEGRQCAG